MLFLGIFFRKGIVFWRKVFCWVVNGEIFRKLVWVELLCISFRVELFFGEGERK